VCICVLFLYVILDFFVIMCLQYQPTFGALLQVQSKQVEIYKASLKIFAKFSGLRQVLQCIMYLTFILQKTSHLLGSMHSPHASTYTLYQSFHGGTRCGRSRANYVDYIQKLTRFESQRSREDVTRLGRELVNLWSHARV